MTPRALPLLLALLALLAATPVLAAPARGERRSPARPAPSPAKTPAPAPAAPGSLTEGLRDLEGSRLSPGEKARLGLRLFRETMLRPDPAPAAAPAVPARAADLARITRALAEGGADPAPLRRQWEGAQPGEVTDCLAAFLALRGVPEAKAAVSALVRDRSRPVPLRELGAMALGELAVRTEDGSVGAVLAQVLREDAAAVPGTQPPAAPPPGKPGTAAKTPAPKPGEPERVLVFPVRKAAAAAIRRMQGAGLLLESYVTAAAERAVVEMPLPARRK